MSDDRNHFLLWEATTRDTIDFKKIYVDMTGDIVAGLMLSEIVYWHLPSKRGENKLRVQKQGEWWIAVSRAEWWDRIRLTPRQADTAIKKLMDCNLIEKRLFKFDGQPTIHIRLLWDNFLASFKQLSENPILQNGESGLTKTDNLDLQKSTIPLTETTAKITEKPLSPATQDDSAATLPTTVKSKKQAKAKPSTHPLRQRNPDKTPNPYVAAVAFFWSGKPYTQWTASERKAEGFRFNKLTEKGGALETLYVELDGFTPEQLARALQVWVDRHPVTPIESRPRENKLVSNIGAILKQIVKTDQHQVLKIGSNLKGLIQDTQPYTDWREHARIAQELAQEQKDSSHE